MKPMLVLPLILLCCPAAEAQVGGTSSSPPARPTGSLHNSPRPEARLEPYRIRTYRHGGRTDVRVDFRYVPPKSRVYWQEGRRHIATYPVPTSLDVPLWRDYGGWRIEVYIPGRR